MLVIDEVVAVEGAEVSDIVSIGRAVVSGGVDVPNFSCQHHATTRLEANKVGEARLHVQLWHVWAESLEHEHIIIASTSPRAPS